MNRIREQRKRKRLTQEEFADILGLKRTTYSAYEKGARSLPMDILIKIAEELNTSTDYLLGITNVETSYNDIIGVVVSKEELEKYKK